MAVAYSPRCRCLMGLSALYVHQMVMGSPLAVLGGKKLDWLGMKYTHPIFCLGILLLASALIPAQAQSQFTAASGSPAPDATSSYTPSASPDEDNSVLTIKKRVDEVNVLFIATDKHGKFVRDLNQQDFSILDDHKPPKSVDAFRKQTNLPIEMGLLVDVSGSVHSRFDFEQQAATDFLQHILRAGYDKAFVVGFNSHGQLAQDYTDSVPKLSLAVQKLHSGGGTALYDAVYRSCREKLLNENPDHPVRKALVILSDGEDNQSEFTKGQAIEMAQRAGVLIYAISTDDSGLILRGDKNLEQLADAT